jgi:hypothetical protein
MFRGNIPNTRNVYFVTKFSEGEGGSRLTCTADGSAQRHNDRLHVGGAALIAVVIAAMAAPLSSRMPGLASSVRKQIAGLNRNMPSPTSSHYRP